MSSFQYLYHVLGVDNVYYISMNVLGLGMVYVSIIVEFILMGDPLPMHPYINVLT